MQSDTVNLDVATDDADNNHAVGHGVDSNDTVYLNVTVINAVGPDAVADDAVGFNLAADSANNDDIAYLNMLTKQSQQFLYEIWGRFFTLQFLNWNAHGPTIGRGYSQGYEVCLVNFIK